MNLWSSFNPTSTEEWKEKIKKDLKIDRTENLCFNTSYGSINPLSEIDDILITDKENPFQEITWKFDSSNSSNENILNQLKNGINSIHLVNVFLDNKLFNDVMNDIIHNHITVDNSMDHQNLCNWTNWINERKDLKGSFRFDPVEETFKKSLRKIDKINPDLFLFTDQNLTNNSFKSILVNGDIYTNLFFDKDLEIAFMAAHLNETIEFYKELNLELPGEVIVRLGLSSSLLENLAKLRALKAIINQVIKTQNVNASIKLECSYDSTLISPTEKEHNLLRYTTACMAAIIGGAERFELNDNMCIKEGNYWKKIIANIPIILLEESQLNSKSDLVEGAHYIEQLSLKMANSGWKHFKAIEQKGGLMEYAKDGLLNSTVESQQEKKLLQLKDSENIIGFNSFTNSNSIVDYNKTTNVPFNLNDLI